MDLHARENFASKVHRGKIKNLPSFHSFDNSFCHLKNLRLSQWETSFLEMKPICLILLFHFIACGCYNIGSQTKKCDQYGKCTCKPDYAGDQCSSCVAGFRRVNDNGIKCIGINVLINIFDYIANSCRCLHSSLTVFHCKCLQQKCTLVLFFWESIEDYRIGYFSE